VSLRWVKCWNGGRPATAAGATWRAEYAGYTAGTVERAGPAEFRWTATMPFTTRREGVAGTLTEAKRLAEEAMYADREVTP
jgi:hypothetical protein